MAVWHKSSGRKKTGGRTRRNRKTKKHEIGSEFSEPQLGNSSTIQKRTRGGNTKNVVKSGETVNLATSDGVEKVEIESVEENSANKNFVRRSLLTKGTIVNTREGKAKITSRPGQDGVINAQLVE